MPVPSTSLQLRRGHLRDDVYVLLRDQIVSGEYRPGQQLHERDLEEQTGASRTPIREALGRLAADGFVEVLPQRETRVALVSLQAVQDALVVYVSMLDAVVSDAVAAFTAEDQLLLRAYADRAGRDGAGEAALIGRGAQLDELWQVFFLAHANPTLCRAERAIALHVRRALTVYPDLGAVFALGAERLGALVQACVAREAAAVRALVGEWGGNVLLGIAPAAPVVARPRRLLVVSRQLLREQVYDALLDAIACGTLCSGERLRDEQLMDWMGVSRTPLREALSRLELIGLVETLPGRLTRVTPLDAGRLVEIWAAMSVFWRIAIRLGTARLDVEDLAALAEISERLTVACDVADQTGAIRAFNDTLLLLAEASENQALLVIVQSLTPWAYRRSDVAPAFDFDRLCELASGLRVALEHNRVGDADVAVTEFFDDVITRVRHADRPASDAAFETQPRRRSQVFI